MTVKFSVVNWGQVWYGGSEKMSEALTAYKEVENGREKDIYIRYQRFSA